jgi:hypothetical protein
MEWSVPPILVPLFSLPHAMDPLSSVTHSDTHSSLPHSHTPLTHSNTPSRSCSLTALGITQPSLCCLSRDQGAEIWGVPSAFDLTSIDEDFAAARAAFPKVNTMRLWMSIDGFMSNPVGCDHAVCLNLRGALSLLRDTSGATLERRE